MSYGEWQPIETAPKDGSSILAWPIYAEYGAPGESEIPYVIRWDKRGYWIEAAGEQYEPMAPTHWMPLPAPPA